MRPRHFPVRLLASLLCAALLLACGNETTSAAEPAPKTCEPTTCEKGGTCDDSTGALLCLCSRGYEGNRCQFCAEGYEDDGQGNCLRACEAGFQDNDSDGDCQPTCETAEVTCESANTVCSDASGEARCVCEQGYQDNDDDGECLPTCESTEVTCEGANTVCSDASGEAICLCLPGHQDNDNDGECLPTCETAEVACEGANTVCSDASGEARCVCEQGFTERDGACVQLDWTLMVFLNGDNDLSDFAAEDLKEMRQMTADDSVNLIVLYDGPNRNDTRLYRFANGAPVELDLDASGIISGTEADMGDWEVLRDFGAWAVKSYPARQYGLFLWNHGAGWKDEQGGRCQNPFKDFSSDDTNGSSGIELSNGHFGQALDAITTAAGERLDLVGFDACLMAMYEVAAVTAEYADYLVASEETEPGWGWSWDVFLQELTRSPRMGPVELGRAIADAYADFAHPDYMDINDGKMNDTVSLTDLTAIDALHSAVTIFADALTEALAAHQSTITSLRSQTKAYSYEEHIDLMHFAELVVDQTNLPATLRSAANGLIAQLKINILHNRTNSYSYVYTDWWYGEEEVVADHTHSNGMAIFFPMDLSTNYRRSDLVAYRNAMWAQKSTWSAFLNEYL